MKELMKYPNVTGVGIGRKITDGLDTGRNAYVVMVEKKLPFDALKPQHRIPREHEDMVTDVWEVGEIKALKERTDVWRPMLPGISIGHEDITAGTLGAALWNTTWSGLVILSNNHVLANSNKGQLGDDILQPGAHDGGTERVASLFDWEPINFIISEGCGISNSIARVANWLARLAKRKSRLRAYQEDPIPNIMDAAVAIPEVPLDTEILEIGEPENPIWGSLGMAVMKSGRTTEYTEGIINVINATITVNYGTNAALFENQFVAGPMSAGGDSGSLVLEQGTRRMVGLLFAGSEQATIFSPIQPILERFNLEIR